MGAENRRNARSLEPRRRFAPASQRVDEPEERLELDRLLEKIGGAELHRLDRRLHRAVAGEHHDRRRRAAGPRRGEHLQAGPRWQLEVGEDEIERLRGCLGRRERRERFRNIGRHLDRVAFAGQGAMHHAAERLAVLDDQEPPHPFRAHRARRARSTMVASISSSSGATVRRSSTSRPSRR